MQSSAQVAGLGRLYRNFQAAGADVPAIFGGNTGPRSRGISKPAYPLPELIILRRDVPQAFWIGENTPRYPTQNFVACGSPGRHPPSPVGDRPNDLAGGT